MRVADSGILSVLVSLPSVFAVSIYSPSPTVSEVMLGSDGVYARSSVEAGGLLVCWSGCGGRIELYSEQMSDCVFFAAVRLHIHTYVVKSNQIKMWICFIFQTPRCYQVQQVRGKCIIPK